MAEEPLEKLGSQLVGFKLLDKIGEGAMGAVYKARQISLDRIVAIKILPPRLAQDPVFVRQFQEEARAAARLSHPHLIAVYEAGRTNGTHFFVMEFVEGENIGDRLRREGPMHEHAAAAVGRNVAQALGYAWEKAQLIHGDIKPENLILERVSNQIRIADLGLAKCLLESLDDFNFADAGYAMGTPAYLSPEQCAGKKDVDFRADMYALGATMYHMLTGLIPFDGLSNVEVMAKHLKGVLPDPRAARPNISEHMVVVLERMMAKEPAMRYPSWAALAHDLGQVQDGLGLSISPLPPGRSTVERVAAQAAQPPPAPKRKASAWRIAIEVAIIAAALGAFYLYMHGRPKQPPQPPEGSVTSPGTGTERATEPTSREPFVPATARGDALPSSIAGLRMWLSAEKNIARDENNFVSAWGDISGSGADAKETAIETRPLFVPDAIHGKPALRFDGKDDQLLFPPLHATDFTIFLVYSLTSCREGSGPLNNRVVEKNGFQLLSVPEGPSAFRPQLVTWNGTDEVDRKRATTSQPLPFGPMIETWTSDLQLFENGIEQPTEDVNESWKLQGGYIGRAQLPMAGDIAEIIIYDSVLPEPDRHAVERHLQKKYAITPSARPPTASIKATTPPPRPSPDKRGEALRTKAAAEKVYAAWRPGFEALLQNGEYAKAKEAASAGLSEPQFAPLKDRLARDERTAQLLLKLRETAIANLVGQPYSVGATQGTVSKIDSGNVWVTLAAGEVAVPLDKLDAGRIPSLALLQTPTDADLQLGAALYCWYRGDKDAAQIHFDAARKAGADITPYLPAAQPAPPPETSAPEPPPQQEPAPERPTRSDDTSMLANHSFERWTGKLLLDWSSGNSQVKPTPDAMNAHDGRTSARFDCDQDSKLWIEQPFHVVAGYKYELRFLYRTKGFEGQLWVEAGAPGDPVPKIKYPLETSEEWQIGTLELESSTTGALALRVRATNARGTLWLDNFDLRLVRK
jgi:serine/threonine-protein kinase